MAALRKSAVTVVLAAVLCLAGLAAVSVNGARSSPRLAPGIASLLDNPSPESLDTAIYDPISFDGADAKLAFSRARQAGTGAVRLALIWSSVASRPLPPSSDPSNPRNPGYDWRAIDRQVQLALRAGLQPILCVYEPPAWARRPDESGSTELPVLRDPSEAGRFMLAAARRYSGNFQGLPRVRYWQVWNEPNVSEYLDPQYSSGRPASPAIYRKLVNAVSDAVHRIHGDNLVIAGGLSPFAQQDATTDPKQDHVVLSPLGFMRGLLCMSNGKQPRPTCRNQIRFDVWAHHPYTRGGPGSHAVLPDNVSLGDLPTMKALLDAAVKAGHVRSSNGVRFWVTEFGWDSNPPDPEGVPVTLEAQWISQALYEMWMSGISLVTWFLLRDGAHFHTGLYQHGQSLAADKPKPTLAAFRFPFVGHTVGGRISVWGRTPWAKPGRILVEESSTGGWRLLGFVQTNRFGIFTQTFGAPRGRYVRARTLGPDRLTSVPFPLAGPRNLDIKPLG